MHMLVAANGSQRDEQEYLPILEQGGWKMEEVRDGGRSQCSGSRCNSGSVRSVGELKLEYFCSLIRSLREYQLF